MAEPWIRVHAALIDKPVIDRAVDALGISEHEAIGLMVTFWGAVSQNVIGGHVADRTNRQLEGWARWKGKRGVFAKFVREYHLDDEGRVNEWYEYAGALERRRAKERDRKAQERARTSRGQSAGRHADTPQDSPRDVTLSVQPARVNETIRNERTTQSVSQSARAKAEPAVAPATTPAIDAVALFDELAGTLTTPEARHRLRTVVDSAASPSAALVALRAMATGNDPAVPTPTPTQLGVALIDFAANGERWNAAHFRGYLRRAVGGTAPETAPAAAGTAAPTNGRSAGARASPGRPGPRDMGGARNDAEIDAWLASGAGAAAEVAAEFEIEPAGTSERASDPDPEEIPHGQP